MDSCVVVSGHSGGIGSELVAALLEKGFKVVGIDKAKSNNSEIEEIVLELEQLVENKVFLDEFRDQVSSIIGQRSLVALINNAAKQNLGALSQLSPAAMQHSICVNSIAPVILAQILEKSLARSRGTIINVTSVHAVQTKPRFAAYAASKAALSAYSRSMSIEWGDRIRTIELRPAAIATPMLEAGFQDIPDSRKLLDEFHPTREIGDARELAYFILQLVQNKSSFLNGAVINYDGGISSCLKDPDS